MATTAEPMMNDLALHVQAIDIDPITVEVIGSALASITDEMGEALIRASYSTNIKERRDCSTALFDLAGFETSDPPSEIAEAES